MGSFISVRRLKQNTRFLAKEIRDKIKPESFSGFYCFNCGKITKHVSSSAVRKHALIRFKDRYSPICMNCGVYIITRAYIRKRLNVLSLDKYECVYCGAREHLTIDHYVPRANKGSSRLTNLVTSCLKCNQAKGSGDAPEAKFGRFKACNSMICRL
jgi:hypothetical protein